MSSGSAVSKRVQRNSGMERTSLINCEEERGSKKKKTPRGKKHRCCPKSQSKPTRHVELRSLQIKFYVQKTPSKISLTTCPSPGYRANTCPLLLRARTPPTGQPLFNKGIKLPCEEKRQFSGPRSKDISTESVLLTMNTAERRKPQSGGF